MAWSGGGGVTQSCPGQGIPLSWSTLQLGPGYPPGQDWDTPFPSFPLAGIGVPPRKDRTRQGGHGTGKTGNLVLLTFSRRETQGILL